MESAEHTVGKTQTFEGEWIISATPGGGDAFLPKNISTRRPDEAQFLAVKQVVAG